MEVRSGSERLVASAREPGPREPGASPLDLLRIEGFLARDGGGGCADGRCEEESRNGGVDHGGGEYPSTGARHFAAGRLGGGGRLEERWSVARETRGSLISRLVAQRASSS